jgi:hypothetical protein
VFPLRDIDESLARLHAAAETAGRNLVDLERDPTVQLLDAANLSGASAGQWAAAREDITQLWLWYTTLDVHLERATEIRKRSNRVPESDVERLSEMVSGRSIQLSIELVPVEERQLLGSSQVTRCCSPDELLERMAVLFDRARSVVSNVGHTWDGLVDRLSVMRAGATEASDLAAALGTDPHPELVVVLNRLAEVGACTVDDPLGVSTTDVDAIDASLRSVRAELDSMVEVRDQIEPRLRACTEVVDEITATLGAATEARDQALARIAGVEFAELPTLDASLPAMLEQIRTMAGRGEWRAVAAALDEVATRGDAGLAIAKRALAEAQAPISTRSELRGLIDAYQAKAFAVGVGEDATVTLRYEEARDLLYNAPTDLALAEQAIVRFRAAISEASGRGGRT